MPKKDGLYSWPTKIHKPPRREQNFQTTPTCVRSCQAPPPVMPSSASGHAELRLRSCRAPPPVMPSSSRHQSASQILQQQIPRQARDDCRGALTKSVRRTERRGGRPAAAVPPWTGVFTKTVEAHRPPRACGPDGSGPAPRAGHTHQVRPARRAPWRAAGPDRSSLDGRVHQNGGGPPPSTGLRPGRNWTGQPLSRLFRRLPEVFTEPAIEKGAAALFRVGLGPQGLG
jgi:hypothetical protein